MAVEAIGGISQATTTDSNNAISQDEFIKLFLAQLNFQDPLEPVDNREFLTQMAQFSQLQVAGEQSKSLQDLVFFSSSDQGISLLGKTVNISLNGTTTSGTIEAIHFNQDGFNVDVKKADNTTITGLSLSNITSVL